MPVHSELDRILVVARDLEGLMRKAKPMPDLTSERMARYLCQQMRGINATMDEALTEIERLLPLFFSLRQHASYPGGAEGIRDRIARELLPRIRIRVEALRRLPDPQ